MRIFLCQTLIARILSHDALVVLRISCSAPKFMHILRSSPCCDHAMLQEIDNMSHQCLITITNVDMSDLQWLQASLPVKADGLGFRSAQKLALSSFLALESSTQRLQSLLLARCAVAPGAEYDKMLATWTATFQPLSPSTGSLAFKQRSFDKPSVDASCALLLIFQPIITTTAPVSLPLQW